MLGETIGSSVVTNSGYLITRTINISGNTITQQPETRIFHIHLISTSGGSSVLTIANGQGGTTQINITGTTSNGIDFDFGPWGITFTNGAYITVDGNLSGATMTYKADKF